VVREAVGVPLHVPDYDHGELAFAGSADLALGLVRCSLRQKCPGRRMTAGLGDMHDVEHRVHDPVSTEIEPVPVRLTVALAG